ncbi:type II secretion system F family protein [Rhizobacter sp. J219]|uniref:type II secretion system F family protein n=1 Tax=Rhizobacter sp. J219 TaxID=2898430 RepID=UPI002150F3E9|nr:type II secretion system F family protein [Rhizobacter sp. J219]MCR5881413.1 type II secretion system F family protein [Rhizobacter sp. J219]
MQLTVAQGRGAPKQIELEAASIAQARAMAMEQGYAVLASRPSTLGGDWWRPIRGRSTFDVPVFIEQLRDLLTAGLSVIESLDALRRGAKGESIAVIQRVEQQLREGKTLSDALAADEAFPPLLVALVRASELTSDLPQSLSRFLDHEQRVAELRHRLSSTAIYPALLMGVGGLVLLFLLFYVMPRFARVFEGMTGELPWSARAMVAWSQLLGGHGAWLVGLACATAAGLAFGLSLPSVRAKGMQALMTWAPLRERLRTYFLSRWYRATGMLVEGGIPLPQALHLANGLLPEALRPGGAAVLQAVNQGLSPSAAHAKAGMATAIAEQLMLAGERTGDLGGVLTRIAQFHDAEVSRSLERGMRALEPVVMVLIGLGVGVVVVLMYMPIFELASAIQ